MARMSHEDAQATLITAYEDVIGDGQTFEDMVAQNPNHWFALGIAHAIGLMEGNYGDWKAVNNWGAITRKRNDDGSCPAGSVPSKDSSFESGEYVACFATYETPLDGATDLLHELYQRRPAVFDAAIAGDVRGVASEMYASTYYMGKAPHDQKDPNGDFTNVNSYIAFIGKGVDEIADLYPSGGAAQAESSDTSGTSGVVVAVVAIGIVGALALALKS